MDQRKRPRNGVFSISSSQQLSGTLSLNGEYSVLHLWANHPVNIDSSDPETITGILDNQKIVSLIDCILIGEERLYGKYGFSQHYKYFPHYVVTGQRRFLESEKAISKVSFVIDDGMSLFHDRSSFGTVNIPPDRVNDVAALDMFGGIPFESNHPVMAYWTGKVEIFRANTEIGRVYACNQPTFNLGGPGGVRIDNEIVIFVDFCNSLSIRELDIEIRNILRFFQSILGRPQNLHGLEIIGTDSAHPESSTMYLNMYPVYPRVSGSREPDFRDILVDAAVDTDRFSRLLCAWMKRDATWHTARSRFAAGWARGHTYDADRIVGAANMFDLVPSKALPSEIPIDESLDAAISTSRVSFRKLPESTKRDEVLGYLGRLRRPSLKEKIRYRSAVISSRIGSDIPKIGVLTDAAVDLRNMYVHGSTFSDDKKEKLQKFIGFLTDTLDFVFCASDLVESEWDVESWHEKRKGVGHPFAEYLRSYSHNLADFLA